MNEVCFSSGPVHWFSCYVLNLYCPLSFNIVFFSLIIWRPHIQLQCNVFIPNFKSSCRLHSNTPRAAGSFWKLQLCRASRERNEYLCSRHSPPFATGFHGFSLWNKRPRQPSRMSYTSMFYLTQQCQAYNVPFISIVYFNTYQEDRKLVINVEGSMRFHYKLM